MKKIFNIIPVIIAMLLTSCEEVVEIDSRPDQLQTVVDGTITNRKGQSYVKVYKTSPYFSVVDGETITGAVVTVIDSDGLQIRFEERDKGMYLCPEDFRGLPGKTYHLNIHVNGDAITAQSTMPDSVLLKNLHLVHVKDDKASLRKGYHLYGTLTDQANTINYFKAERYVNGTRQQMTAKDLHVFDDQFFEGVQEVEGSLAFWGNESDDDYVLKTGDTVSIKLYALDPQAFHYFKAMKSMPSQGGLYGKNPANLPGNLSGALGIFHATAFTISNSLIVHD